jgi:uncharacterized membrane protein YjjP (DUF1212 family)
MLEHEEVVDFEEEDEMEEYEESLIRGAGDKQEDEHTRKKKFIFRLVLALHSSGNVSYKTEEYIRLVAHVYGLHCSCAIFPVTAMITFHENSAQLNPHSSESYSLR